jgi:hypothetical protein
MSAAVDLQGVFARFMPAYRARHRLTPRQGQVCAHVRDCRTAALGVLEQRCTGCGFEQVHFASCRDRHCPKCQGRASARWAEREAGNVLAVPYHHVVFTLPERLNGWVSLHPEAVYAQLFASAWATLAAFAERHLGGRLGMSAVLHTWGEQLTRHVHLHCLVPGGALDADGDWHAARGDYLFPVRALSRRFRGHFVAGLRRRAQAGELDRITNPGEVDAMLDALMGGEWVVYAKPCLNHTASVLAYLARYTHRIALSEQRLVGIDGERVGLRYRDYRDERAHKTVWLEGTELVRRFLLHVLPKGFMRIRHYGLLANRCRAQCLATARDAIAAARPRACVAAIVAPVHTSPAHCPRCRQRSLHTVHRPARHRLEGG